MFLRRRAFIALLGGAAMWPFMARAQRVPAVGLVAIGATPTEPGNLRPFLAQMRELGYVDGQNVVFDRRFGRVTIA